MCKMIGQRYNRLTVTEKLENRKVRVRCDCGTEKTVHQSNLGRQISCGCYKPDPARKHGHCVGGLSPAYASWKAMVQRCTDPNTIQWKDYGGRGIIVFPRWLDFQAFIKDVGAPPSDGLSIDRIKNDRGYEPGNVKWSTRSEQCRNRLTSRFLELNGVRKTAAEWSEITGISQSLIYQRTKLGWSVDRTLTTPTRRCVRLAA